MVLRPKIFLPTLAEDLLIGMNARAVALQSAIWLLTLLRDRTISRHLWRPLERQHQICERRYLLDQRAWRKLHLWLRTYRCGQVRCIFERKG